MEKLLIDSHVFLEVLLHGGKEKQASEFLSRIEGGKSQAVASALCITEVKYHVLKKASHEKAAEAAYFVQMFPNIEVIPVTTQIASRAADLRFKYYDRKNKPVSLADAVHIATAIESGCTKIISGEPDFKDLEEIPAEIY